MDKLTFTSTNKLALTFLDKQEIILPKESQFSLRKFFLSLVSEYSVLLINFHQRRQKKYVSLLGSLNRKIGNGTSPDNNSKVKTIGISKEIVEGVLLKLNAFEQNKGFLSTKVSLSSLSKSLETNSSYLSKIINHTQGKTFKNYLNDLRILYAHETLKSDPQHRKYTIEAIAFDFGFKSAENFSKKFKAAYGMYPSKFMRGLAKTSV
jgi:AraC-like DNA-binding protein|tara:strand:- start:81 stop:701 length:621 start_codon:yes stop_codon:yes gene_type:complete